MHLTIRDLSKTYPNGTHALSNVSLDIPRGMFGLLGPNGAGKSTLMRIVATLQEPDRGTVHLGDLDVVRDKDAVRRTLGYLPQSFGFYPRVKAERLLEHFAVLKGIASEGERRDVVAALLQRTNLWDVRAQRVGTFSGGMKQRLGVAIALLGRPQLIIVDEPTAGLDPAERVRFLNLLSEIGEESAVILSTHIVEDVAELCNRMAIIDRGRILMSADPADALAGLRGRIWRRTVDRGDLARVEQELPVISTKMLAGRTLVHVYADTAPSPDFAAVEPDLKDLYFSVMTRHHGAASVAP